MITVGIDEVGRGCWAGPLVAGAVILNKPIFGLRDSKKLSKSQRERFEIIIEKEAAAIGLGWVSPTEIDKLGLTESVRLAMHRALEELIKSLQGHPELVSGSTPSCRHEFRNKFGMTTESFDEIIIDGNYNYFSEIKNARAIVKADDIIPSVSAASIIAKVARDKYMAEVVAQFPNYAFEKHVGYGTKVHIEKLQAFGICDLHRKSYKPVQKIMELSS
jgi:ribonuclease HII